MIKVTMGNNVKRSTEILEADTTLREALEIAEIDYTTGIMNLDGSTLNPGSCIIIVDIIRSCVIK